MIISSDGKVCQNLLYAVPPTLSWLKEIAVTEQDLIWRYSVFANILGGDTVIWMKNWRYSVFQSPNGDGNTQFWIENTTVTVFIQKFDYGITVFWEKINGNVVI